MSTQETVQTKKKTTIRAEGGLETGLLSFARSLQIAESVFTAYSSDGAKCEPVRVLEKGVRGQSSEDKAKNPGLSNPQVVHHAYVPLGCDTLQLSFSMRVMPLSLKPHACDNSSVSRCYAELASAYQAAGGYRALAELFTWNIANARFAWRNRAQTDESQVIVSFAGKSVSFDPFCLDLSEYEGIDAIVGAVREGSAEVVEDLVSGIESGLSRKAFSLDVKWRAKVKEGQEVFPSQEYVREHSRVNDLARVYASLPTYYAGERINQASIHSQKINAALRHIDVWHMHPEYGAIAVNPYGGVQETGEVIRNKGIAKSFYEIRKDPAAIIASLRAAKDRSEIPGDVHFMMANLVRGGVLGLSSKE